jgi:membrane-bound lytic murein transglycosylase D
LLYKVGPGDTLIGIARQFAMDVDDVARENGLDDDDKLQSGAILKLRVKPSMLELTGLDAVEKKKPEAEPKDEPKDEAPKRKRARPRG